jgi:hypothetical protein
LKILKHNHNQIGQTCNIAIIKTKMIFALKDNVGTVAANVNVGIIMMWGCSSGAGKWAKG